jgi:hypothetical protein
MLCNYRSQLIPALLRNQKRVFNDRSVSPDLQVAIHANSYQLYLKQVELSDHFKVVMNVRPH